MANSEPIEEDPILADLTEKEILWETYLETKQVRLHLQTLTRIATTVVSLALLIALVGSLSAAFGN